MHDRLLVEALRARHPDAFARLYDACVNDLYDYCLFLLEDAARAVVAFRDTLLVAEGRIDELIDPDSLRTWLYAISRAECLRRGRAFPAERRAAPRGGTRRAGHPTTTDLAVVAVAGVPPREREILGLMFRHDLCPRQVAAVIGRSVRDVEKLAASGRKQLRRSFVGALQTAADAEEGGTSAICAKRRLLQKSVSTAKVFAILPTSPPPVTLRERVLHCTADTELAEYKRFVARRAGSFGAGGFPHQPRRALGHRAAVRTLLAACAVSLMVWAGMHGLHANAWRITPHHYPGAERVTAVLRWVSSLPPIHS